MFLKRRRACVGFVFTLLFIGCLSGVIYLWGVVFRAPAKPKIHVYNRVVDLGIINEVTGPKRIEFKIENRGGAQLYLKKVAGSCPCLDLKVDRHQLSPGQQAALIATVSPAKKPGDWSDTILVQSNDPDNDVIELTIKAFIELTCTVVPKAILVESLRKDQPYETELRIIGPSNDLSFQVVGLSSDSNAITLFETREAGIMQELGRRIWNVRVLVHCRGLESWKDNILISTSVENLPKIEVPVTVYELLDIKVRPKVVFLRQIEPNSAPLANVEISDEYTDIPLEIANVNAPDWLEVTVEDLAGHNGKLLRLKALPGPSSKTGPVKGRMVIYFTGDNPCVDLPVLLWIKSSESIL